MNTQLSDKAMKGAVVDVFKTYGFGPFDLEAVIHFAIARFEPNPFTYLVLHNQLQVYIITNFQCRPGSLKSVNEMNLRRTLVYYEE